MSNHKRIESERRIDRSIGISTTGKPNVTEAWQKILQESNNEFTELNDLLKDSEIFPKNSSQIKFPELGHEGTVDLFADSVEHFQLDKVESASSLSIQPAPITLNSDFAGSRDAKNGKQSPKCVITDCVFVSGCCLSTERKSALRYLAAQKRIRKCNVKLSNFCHQLKEKFEGMETLLRFHSPEVPSSMMPPEVVNVASAQLWFVTFALAREFNHSAQMDRRDIIFFRKKYQTVLAYARRLSADFSSIDASLTIIEAKVGKQIHGMKDALTGSSRTDLATIQISPNDDFFVEGGSWAELSQRHPDHVNQYRSTPAKDAVPSVSYLLQTLDRPDTLRERKQLEIFVKNITKSGWSRYEESFSSGQRMRLLRLLLSHTLGVIAQVIGICGKVKGKLMAANYSKLTGILTCRDTLLPWFQETKDCVNYCVKSSKYGTPEFEFLRYYIFASEIRLNKVFKRGRKLGRNVEDIYKVATISADLLEQKYGLMLPNYEEIRPYIKLWTDEKVSEDSAVSAFYLHEYGNVLKQYTIRFRISHFILSKKIQLQERHSGVDFGKRFFSKSEPYLNED